MTPPCKQLVTCPHYLVINYIRRTFPPALETRLVMDAQLFVFLNPASSFTTDLKHFSTIIKHCLEDYNNNNNGDMVASFQWTEVTIFSAHMFGNKHKVTTVLFPSADAALPRWRRAPHPRAAAAALRRAPWPPVSALGPTAPAGWPAAAWGRRPWAAPASTLRRPVCFPAFSSRPSLPSASSRF
jgi:hypothetical protein